MKMGFSLQEGTIFLNFPNTHWVLEEIITSLHSFLPMGFCFARNFFWPTLFTAFWT
jgi:hypothetical protein